MIERSQIRVPVGGAGEFFFQCQLSVLTLISASVSTPVLPQKHVKDPGHSAKRAGGRLQLKTHALYVCGFA